MKTLERSLGTTTREHEKEKQGLVATDRRKIAEMELDGQGLRQLVRMKTKELVRDASRTWRRTRTHHHLASHLPLLPLQASVKKLAAIVLHKRNEVETFLLESIEQVKAEIGRQRAEEERLLPRGSRGQLLPSLTGGNRPSKLPSSADERVDIRDLTWDDRERVLRLLFARINNSEPFQAMPPHPLQSADLDAARRQAALDAAAEDDGGQYGGGGFFPTQPEVA